MDKQTFIDQEFFRLQTAIHRMIPRILDGAIYSVPKVSKADNGISMEVYTNPDEGKKVKKYSLFVIVNANLNYCFSLYEKVNGQESKLLFEKKYTALTDSDEDRQTVYQTFNRDLYRFFMHDLLEYTKFWTSKGYGKQLLSLDPYRHSWQSPYLRADLTNLMQEYQDLPKNESAVKAYAEDVSHKFEIMNCRSDRIPEILQLVKKKAKRYHYHFEDILELLSTDLATEMYNLPWNILDRSLDVELPLLIPLDVSGDLTGGKAALCWIAKAAGKGDIFLKALPELEKCKKNHLFFTSTDDFVDQLLHEAENFPEDAKGTLTFFASLTFGEILQLIDVQKNGKNGSIIIPRGCSCGLYNIQTHERSSFGIGMCQDITIPVKNIQFKTTLVSQVAVQESDEAVADQEKKLQPSIDAKALRSFTKAQFTAE